eukprot:Selendium_serpulae@DN5062_c0_g1_i2.p1
MLMGGTATLFYGCYLAMLAVMLVCAVYPLPSIVQMMVYTFSMIFIGSHRSLMQKEVDPDSGERVSQHETLTQRDAMLFPIIASASLLGLYLAYKFLPPFWVNVLLASYVSVVGIVTLSQSIASMLDIHKKFHKFFFWSCMVGYQIGLGITTAVMLMFNAPQPALLYLVPTCLAAVYLPASLTGRMSQILSYSESTEEDPEEEARETTTSPAKEKAKDEGNIEMKETLLSAS